MPVLGCTGWHLLLCVVCIQSGKGTVAPRVQCGQQ
ncbi:hypothetical protein CPT_Paso_013 [Rhizobium phage Paso]|uniref:Uncharacterized protein n=1 Tax=Rhizobium phage Paso TaxID=2767574 RepID=A0A7L8G6L9_9CAUD|nr:hypothetical protein CPT_Paso_013 [Rhizobium phage Paso]